MKYESNGGFFYLNPDGKYHNEKGPAISLPNGYKEWYINGIKYTEEEYKVKMRSEKLKQIL